MSGIAFDSLRRSVSVVAAAAISCLFSILGVPTGVPYSSGSPPDSHCQIFMFPPRSMGEKIVFDARVTCDPVPLHSTFVMRLIKFDYGNEDGPRHQVERHEYTDPRYYPADGFTFTEYHDCSINPESRTDGYRTELSVTQWNDGWPAIGEYYTEPLAILYC